MTPPTSSNEPYTDFKNMNPIYTETSRYETIRSVFAERFGEEHILVRSPGRVNLIGEHTDYNQGLVLPAAINKDIVMAIGRRDDDAIHLYSIDQNDSYQTTTRAWERSPTLWPDYVIGVVQQLFKRDYLIGGFNLVFGGNIPLGAGLSSSAALECATTFALSELFDLRLEKLDIALISQAAENEFVGVKCGLMDQFASVFGKEGQLIKLDCRDFSYEYIPFQQDGYKIVLFDTQVKHSLASSAYNKRREECEYGVSLIARKNPHVESLREATLEQVETLIKPIDEVVYRRCRYVVSEIQRLQDASTDLQGGNIHTFGRRMFNTHDGLQYDYEVSCRELDILVDIVRKDSAVMGARMMGGGFGGCTINLVKTEELDRVVREVNDQYEVRTGLVARTYIGQVAPGTSRLS